MKLIWNGLSCAILLTLVGCGGGDMWTDKQPETVMASGHVTLDGQPVEGAQVVCNPYENDHNHACSALTDSSGYFELIAFPSKKGAVPGNYQVGVSKTIEINQQFSAADLGEDAAHATEDPATAGLTWKNTLPEKYANPLTSGITIRVGETGTSGFKIELSSK